MKTVQFTIFRNGLKDCIYKIKYSLQLDYNSVTKGLIESISTYSVTHALADLCYYVNPDSSRKTCKYKHSSYREYVKGQKEKRLRGLSLLTDKEHIRWLYFNTHSEPTGSIFVRSI
ncbi:hypothetical protein T02_12995 [Trichinella nativa]|uniref:Uncharacterized protein n=1 Tax=Trichinella nativa TaxID=6335 RepID=A0A0V1KNZ8_9BILA|nr:hypothetical protein T02_12995 [Trichinella nativa]